MAGLTIAGTEYPVCEGTFRELPPAVAGSERVRYDNSIGSSERSPRRRCSCSLFFPPEEVVSGAVNAFLDAVSVLGQRGVPTDVPIDGVLLRGTGFTGRVRVGELQYVPTYLSVTKSDYYK